MLMEHLELFVRFVNWLTLLDLGHANTVDTSPREALSGE